MIEQRLRTLGSLLALDVNEEQRKWYVEFLDAAEWGVALEMLADWLSETERPLANEPRAETVDLARLDSWATKNE